MDESAWQLHALSPLDGRYKKSVAQLSSYFSEYALIRYRLIVEIEYLLFLGRKKIARPFSLPEQKKLRSLVDFFDTPQAAAIKKIEQRIHHDVKAVEYYLREQMTELGIEGSEWIHFGLTSEDTNACAYGLALQAARKEILIPAIQELIAVLVTLATNAADMVMLARTHGQVAVPTTMGKELIVFIVRLQKELQILATLPIEGKITGAVGNFNAHVSAFPEFDWLEESAEFVSSLGLQPNTVTTQILPADALTHVFSSLQMLNTILIGLSQDIWRYISDGYFIQSVQEAHVGSSTMPQKVNPIDFENAEGNLGVANALFAFCIAKLPISRLQRDLSDSTVKRNIGVALGYSLLAYQSLTKGITKIRPHAEYTKSQLEDHWEVILEGIQTVLRVSGTTDAYEKVKEFSRGKTVTQESIQRFIATLDIDQSTREKLLSLTPTTYLGLASNITHQERKTYGSQTKI